MGLLSSTVSIAQYKIYGELKRPIIETVTSGLKKNMIFEIDGQPVDKAVGWTSFDNPFKPNFEGSSFSIGTYLIFSMRIDKKSIPPKVIKKHSTVEETKILVKSGRKFLSSNEKREIKERVIEVLNIRVPATPNVYDILWNYEEAVLWFFSNLKAANEEFETFFSKSFGVTPIRLFPYTMADLMAGLTDADRDALTKLSPTVFAE